jgi:levansucrase
MPPPQPKDQNVIATVPSVWSRAQVAAIVDAPLPELAVFGAADAAPMVPDQALWDCWPVRLADGSLAHVCGGSLWVILSAPRGPDPDSRHDMARMRLMHHTAEGWTDCGNLLPDGLSPGSREWSGSTLLDPLSGSVTLWFTAAGRRAEAVSSFEQRLFQVSGHLDVSGRRPVIAGWNGLEEAVRNDGRLYADLATRQGVPGRIKGFRDPSWFRDPADGRAYLLFTGSKAADQSLSEYDGVVGLAAADPHGNGFSLLPHILEADGVANELELPHMLVREGLYYLFWSTQRSVFSPDGPVGPTGLYGMVGPTVTGPFVALNGTGLVLTNPAAEPHQAYAWQVLPTLEVVSFVNYWGLGGRDPATDPELKSARFGGTIAPMARIELAGATTRIVAGGI